MLTERKMKLGTGTAIVLAGITAISGSIVSATALADARHPTVVELFQSQGCSDCPPANANVIALSERPDLLTLSLGVTYWDNLGWKDTFASPRYTSRQWDYARAFHRNEVFTPEVVVNGRADVVGSNRSELEALIGREARRNEVPSLEVSNDVVQLGGGDPGAHADVWLVRYDPSTVEVPIQAGENEGRTLPHKNVVKELVKLGEWSGKPETFRVPRASGSGLRSAVLVQDGPGGAILTAVRL
jgi:hypothetical protein